MICPPFLKRGDKVAVIATARKISEEELSFAFKTLRDWGLEPVTGANLYAVENQFAGSDEQRAADLQWAINQPEIRAIFIARGGYGTVRVVDQVDFSQMRPHPKWVVGYSDVTVLHSHIQKFYYTATIHGTMPLNFHKNAEATETLRKCLFGESLSYITTPHSLNRTGTAKGEIVGGNLSLLYALAGTPDDLDLHGKILFLEDLDEYLYHVDRMMMNLKRSGKLRHLAGLVVGGMSEMKDNAIPFGKNAEEIIYDAVREYSYPVCFNFPAGHIDRNLAIYLGKEVVLEVSNAGGKMSYTSEPC